MEEEEMKRRRRRRSRGRRRSREKSSKEQEKEFVLVISLHHNRNNIGGHFLNMVSISPFGINVVSTTDNNESQKNHSVNDVFVNAPKRNAPILIEIYWPKKHRCNC